MTVPSIPPITQEFCQQCGEKIINRGAHWERCTGPRAYGQCDCDPGYKHDPACWLVTGGDAA